MNISIRKRHYIFLAVFGFTLAVALPSMIKHKTDEFHRTMVSVDTSKQGSSNLVSEGDRQLHQDVTRSGK